MFHSDAMKSSGCGVDVRVGWIPFCPPGCLDSYCSRLRDSISVLFHFERQPVVDQDFTMDCRKWLIQLVHKYLFCSDYVELLV